jgi:hypothetical protein
MIWHQGPRGRRIGSEGRIRVGRSFSRWHLGRLFWVHSLRLFWVHLNGRLLAGLGLLFFRKLLWHGLTTSGLDGIGN